MSLGTANDFSRVLGWGASAPRVLLGKRLVNFKGMLTQWLNASIVPYDIWEVITLSITDDQHVA